MLHLDRENLLLLAALLDRRLEAVQKGEEVDGDGWDAEDYEITHARLHAELIDYRE